MMSSRHSGRTRSDGEQRTAGAPTEEVVVVIERPVGPHQVYMISNVEVGCVDPCRRALAEVGGAQGYVAVWALAAAGLR